MDFNQTRAENESICEMAMSAIDNDSPTFDWTVRNKVQYTLERIINPFFAVWGILGNIVNLIILNRRSWKQATNLNSPIEQSAHLGLCSLALIDGMYCVSCLATSLQNSHMVVFEGYSASLFVHLYGVCFQNWFMGMSTWAIVLLAGQRYIGICHPLQARIVINRKTLAIGVLLIAVFCGLLEMPALWQYSNEEILCEERKFIFTDTGVFTRNKLLNTSHRIVWFLLVYLIPLVLLTFCNTQLIRALRSSRKMRNQSYVRRRSSSDENPITPTLIGVIVMFLILVTPSEIIGFPFYFVQRIDHYEDLKLAVTAANVCITINCSCNFLLYLVVNVQFRRTVKDICTFCRRKKHTRGMSYSSSKSFGFSQTTYAPAFDNETRV